MTERQLEERLRAALEHAAPNDVEGVLSRCAPRQGGAIPITAARARPKKHRWLPLAAAACLVLAVTGGGVGYYLQSNTVASIISLDVNPGVELTVNRQEKVLSAAPTNEDAVDILDGMELKGTPLDVAMNAIVGSLVKNGYVDELANSILITVEDEDTARGARLQQELTSQADAVLASSQVNVAILSQTFQHNDALQQKADEYGISAGKAALIQTIADSSSGLYTFEELVGLPINDLNLLYTSLFSFRPADPEDIGVIVGSVGSSSVQTLPSSGMIQTSGQASDSAYIGVEAAQAAAFSHAGVSAAQATVLEIDFDYEDGRMVSELEFYANGSEYEYDIDALTGAVVKSQQESRGSAPSGGAPSGADIGEQGAKEAALAHAGLTEGDVVSLSVKREYDDGRLEYEVKFWVDTTEYDYTIAAADGSVLKQERETHRAPNYSGSGTGGSGTQDVGAEAAKSAALKHAGVSESQATDVKVKQDWDDGRLEYEVEFWVGSTEYDYTIDAVDGSVVAYDTEKHASASSTDIGAEAAESAALGHAGLSESQVAGLRSERDYDDGRLEYEVEFRSGGMEYEYTIDGASGAILEYEKDWDD